MTGAVHTPADGRAVRAQARREQGWTLLEVIVVMVLVGIAMLAALSTLTSVKGSSADARYAAAAGSIWRGIGAFRLESKGVLPTYEQVGATGTTFRNLAGARYVTQWPEDPRSGSPLQLHQGSGATAPTRATPDTVHYASTGATAWIAAYGHDGTLVFRRSIRAGSVPEVPIG